MSRILIVEDEPALLRALADNFRFEGYEVVTSTDGETACQLAIEQSFSLIILDVMLPGITGYDVCRRLRAKNLQIPILMLTARGEETDRVVGLDLGADDYVTKPFSLLELNARVRALLRRSIRTPADIGELTIGDVRVNFRNWEATRGGQPLDLTRKEFQVLAYLVSRPGTVVTRDELLENVWGQDVYPTTRTVDTHIANLRARIEPDARRPRHLLTVHGVGYRWVP